MHAKRVVFDGDGGTVEIRDYQENRAGKVMEVILGHIVFTKRLMDGRRLWDLYRAGSDDRVADDVLDANETRRLEDIALALWRSTP